MLQLGTMTTLHALWVHSSWPFGYIPLGILGPFLLASWVHSYWPLGSIPLGLLGPFLLASWVHFYQSFGSIPTGLSGTFLLASWVHSSWPFGSIPLGLSGSFLQAFWVHSSWPFRSIPTGLSGPFLLALGSVPYKSLPILKLLFFAIIMAISAISSIAVRIDSCTDGIGVGIGKRNYRGLYRPFDGLDMISMQYTEDLNFFDVKEPM